MRMTPSPRTKSISILRLFDCNGVSGALNSVKTRKVKRNLIQTEKGRRDRDEAHAQ